MYGSPEQGLLAAAATQLANRYGLAAAGNVMLSDSNAPDYMAGFEAGATAFARLPAWSFELILPLAFGVIAFRSAIQFAASIRELWSSEPGS